MDLRTNEWRQAIVEIAKAVEDSPLRIRALALLIADMTPLSMTQVIHVLRAIPELPSRYLKEEDTDG